MFSALVCAGTLGQTVQSPARLRRRGHRKSRSNGRGVGEAGGAAVPGKHQEGGLRRAAAEGRLPYFISRGGNIELKFVLLWKSGGSEWRKGEEDGRGAVGSVASIKLPTVSFTFCLVAAHSKHSATKIPPWPHQASPGRLHLGACEGSITRVGCTLMPRIITENHFQMWVLCLATLQRTKHFSPRRARLIQASCAEGSLRQRWPQILLKWTNKREPLTSLALKHK